jgi:hypothetical protein
MSDLQTLFQQVDDLSPDEIKQLYDYIVNNHVKFVPVKSAEEPLKQRVLGLHAHLGPHWMSDDFDDELPDEFWFGEG